MIPRRDLFIPQAIRNPKIVGSVKRRAGVANRKNKLNGEHANVVTEMTVADRVPAVVDQGQIVRVKMSAGFLVSAGRPVTHVEPSRLTTADVRAQKIFGSYCDSVDGSTVGNSATPSRRTDTRSGSISPSFVIACPRSGSNGVPRNWCIIRSARKRATSSPWVNCGSDKRNVSRCTNSRDELCRMRSER